MYTSGLSHKLTTAALIIAVLVMGGFFYFLVQEINKLNIQTTELESVNLTNSVIDKLKYQIAELEKEILWYKENKKSYKSFVNNNYSDSDYDRQIKTLLDERINEIVVSNKPYAGKWFITDITLPSPNQAIVQHEDGHYESTSIIQIRKTGDAFSFQEIQ